MTAPAWDNRDDSSHPEFNPLTDLGPSGIPKSESRFLLLNDTPSLIVHCGKCRDVVSLAHSSLAHLGGPRFEPFVRLSVSSSGHVFAFRVLSRNLLRAEYAASKKPFDFPSSRFHRPSLPPELRMKKLSFRVTAHEWSLIKSEMEKDRLSLAAVLRVILFEHFRDALYFRKEPELDISRLPRPSIADTLVKEFAVVPSVVSLASSFSLSSGESSDRARDE